MWNKPNMSTYVDICNRKHLKRNIVKNINAEGENVTKPGSCGPSTRRYILVGKHSELYIYFAVEVETCCRRIEEIGAVLSGDLF